METTSACNTTTLHVRRNLSLIHRSFYWGHNSIILFSGWPGSRPGMYALALIFVFVLAVLVEWLSYCSFIKPGANKVGAGFFQTGLYAVRAGLNYLVILALVSFNGGVFLVSIFGHAVGFLIFGSRAFRKTEKVPDLPPRK